MKDWKGFTKGVNLGGWMSQCDYSQDRLMNFIKEEDFAVIASWGLDHVRLPIDYNVLENKDGTEYKEEGFALVAKAVSWAHKNGLNIVLDLHKTAGFSFDSNEKETGLFENEAYQERFYKLREEFAKRFGNDERIAFELLNEVTDQSFSPIWNAIADKCIARIRKVAPETIILVGSYWNNAVAAVKDMNPPYDERVVYNCHCYDPIKFTHQHASWVPFCTELVTPFEEAGATEEYFEDLFKSAIEYAEKNNTILYCGEYGVIDFASPEDTVKWYKNINAVLSRHGIGRAAWTYRQMSFGLSDARLDGVREELIKYL